MTFVHLPVAYQAWRVRGLLLVAVLVEFVDAHRCVPYRQFGRHTRHAVTAYAQFAVTFKILGRHILSDVFGFFHVGRGIEHGDAVLRIVGSLALVAQRQVHPLVFRQHRVGLIDIVLAAHTCAQLAAVVGRQ